MWLMQGAQRFRKDAELSAALQRVAKQQNSRELLLLLAALSREPGLAERLREILLAPPGKTRARQAKGDKHRRRR